VPQVGYVREAWSEAPIVRQDHWAVRPVVVNAGHPSALFPRINVFNHFYPEVQAKLIGRNFIPPTGLSMVRVVQKGTPASGQLSDEALRQLARGWSLLESRTTFYQTATQ
jgi:hypothetical protein